VKAFASANFSLPLQRVLYPDFQTEVKETKEAMCCSRVPSSANFCSKTKESDNQLNQSPIAHLPTEKAETTMRASSLMIRNFLAVMRLMR